MRWLLLLATGCSAPVDLGHVPIQGGTEAQRERIAEELVAFELWAGAGRVRLSSIEVEEDLASMPDYRGAYDSLWQAVRVRADIPDAELRDVVRHELCHAIDFQERLLADPHPAFDALVAAAKADPDHPLGGATDDDDDRSWRTEAFAYACQDGPIGAAALEHACPGDDPVYAEIGAFLSERVWTDATRTARVPPFALDPVLGSWEATTPPQQLLVVGSATSDAALVYPQPYDGTAATISTIDGAAVYWFDDFTLSAIDDGYDGGSPAGLQGLQPFDVSVAYSVDAVSDGETTLRLGRRLGVRVGNLAPRVFAEAGGRWSVVQGACPTAASSLFVANDQLYVGWAEDRDVVWAPVVWAD